MSESMEEQRRHDDRDRMLNQKLDHMERENQSLHRLATALETAVNTVKLEQTHLRDLFDARFRVVEKGAELQLSETKQIAKDIQMMGSDVDKSPATRSLQQQLDEQREKLNAHEDAHTRLRDWQNQVEGVLAIVKWIGAGGVLAIIIAVIRVVIGK
jgi:chromosome segregation ATPase